MTQKFILNLIAIALYFKFKRKERKMELWEKDLSFIKRTKINARVKWRRFDTQTRGMGFIFVFIMALMLVVNIVPFLFLRTITQLENQPYQESLKKACIDKEFYNLNFRGCETVGVRP